MTRMHFEITHAHVHTHMRSRFIHTHTTDATENAAPPKSANSKNSDFLGISRYKIKLEFWFYLNLYPGI